MNKVQTLPLPCVLGSDDENEIAWGVLKSVNKRSAVLDKHIEQGPCKTL